MSTEQQLNNLAEDVREEGLNQGNSMKDLVFDPVTGDFRQVPRGTHHGEGDVVTEMTNKGFAVEAETPIVYLREDELNEANECMGKTKYKYLFALLEAVDEEGVFRVHLKSQRAQIPMRLYLSKYYTHDDLVKGNVPIANCRFRDRTYDEGIFELYQPSNHMKHAEIPGFFTNDEGFMHNELIVSGSDCCFCVLVSETGPEVWCRLNPYGGKSDDWKKAEVFMLPSEENLFSRSKGILEVGALRDKRVMIVGLGSFGSHIAIELAKAGVGHFALMDFDRVELHNLSRHTATVNDLGRLKTNVIEEAILGKNPYAKVDKYPVNINDDLPLLYEKVGKADLVICATDNNTSRFNLSKALVEKEKVGIFGRAITRAEGGDVFRYRPGGPCYCCLIGEGNLQEEEITDVASARRDGKIAAYVSPEDADAMVQVGLSSDIEPICNMMVKLSLLELSRGTETGISCLEEELTYDYYIWANRRERHYANWKPMPNAGGMPTILRWYGAHIEKEANCPICSGSIEFKEDGTSSVIHEEEPHVQLTESTYTYIPEIKGFFSFVLWMIVIGVFIKSNNLCR